MSPSMRSAALRISLRKDFPSSFSDRTAFIVERFGESFEDAQRSAQIVAGRRREGFEFLVRRGKFLLVFGHVLDGGEHQRIALARRHELQARDEIAAVGAAHRHVAHCGDLARRAAANSRARERRSPCRTLRAPTARNETAPARQCWRRRPGSCDRTAATARDGPRTAHRAGRSPASGQPDFLLRDAS